MHTGAPTSGDLFGRAEPHFTVCFWRPRNANPIRNTTVARSTYLSLLGVAQGSDLLLYLFIVAMLFYIVHQYRRMLVFDKTTTDLAREIALLRAQLEEETRSKTAGK